MATSTADALPKRGDVRMEAQRQIPGSSPPRVALAAFMEVLDTSIANVALPHIAGSLGASVDQSTWVLTSYLVANAIVLPMGAWAASVIGRKNFFMLCIVIFTISSFLCGIAPTLGLLLLFRVFQGVGGGGLQPMAQAIMADSFEPSKRGLAFSLYGVVAVLAPSIGPTLGGWITDNYSWHWIFYINIPVGILALFLTNRLVEDPPFQKSDRANLYRIDYIGVGLLVIAMGALQITLDKGEEKNWFGSHFIVGFAVTFIISFIALILWEFHTERPLMDLRLFKFKNFAVCAFLMLLTGGLLNATTVLQPQFLQQQLGYTATIAGLSLSGGGLALLVVMPMAGQAVSRFPARNLIAMGFVLFALSYFYTATHISLLISFAFRILVACLANCRHSFRFHFRDHGCLFRYSSGKEQPGFGTHQFRPQYRWQHSDLAHQRPGDAAGAVASGRAFREDSPAGRNYQQQIDALRGVFDTSAGKANGLHLAQGQLYNQLQRRHRPWLTSMFIMC